MNNVETIPQLAMRPAEMTDIPSFIANLRQADLDACNAASPGPIADKLRAAMALGEVVLISLTDGQPIALWSVVPMQHKNGVGVIGLLLTNAAEERMEALHGVLHPALDEALRTYHTVTNVVHMRNEMHVLWLKRVGADFIAHHPKHGEFGEPFSQFTLTRNNRTPLARRTA